jgi:Fe2+ or Zn2+ uptake regulation protein
MMRDVRQKVEAGAKQFLEAGQEFTIKQLHLALAREGNRINVDSVRRHVLVLVDEGLLERRLIGGKRYVLCSVGKIRKRA